MPKCTPHTKSKPRLFRGGKETITTHYSFFILFLQRWRLPLLIFDYDRFFHFWGCVGGTLSSHKEPRRQLAEGTCHPVAHKSAHPSPSGLPQGGRLILLWSGQERDFTNSSGKLPKLLALLNPTWGWGMTVGGGGEAPTCLGESMQTFRNRSRLTFLCYYLIAKWSWLI